MVCSVNGSKEMGDELAKLVVDGIKTATYAAYCLYEFENEEPPKQGHYNIVLDGSNQPAGDDLMLVCQTFRVVAAGTSKFRFSFDHTTANIVQL